MKLLILILFSQSAMACFSQAALDSKRADDVTNKTWLYHVLCKDIAGEKTVDLFSNNAYRCPDGSIQYIDAGGWKTVNDSNCRAKLFKKGAKVSHSKIQN